MTSRVAAENGVEYCLPSHWPEALGLASHWSSFIESTSPDRSVSTFSDANDGAWVLPSSMTSGGLSPPRAVVSLSWMPFHSWTSYLTVTPLCACSNSLLSESVRVSGAEPFISHTVRVRGSPAFCSSPLLSVPPDPAQPAVASAMAVKPTIAFVQRFTSLPSLPSPPNGSDRVVQT